MLASLLGAAIASAGVVGVLSPFKSAAAGPPPGQADALNAVLADMQPGAQVTPLDNGGYAVKGTETAAVHADLAQARALVRKLPESVRCATAGITITCKAVSGDDALAALKAGATDLYGLTIYRGITADKTAQGAPVLEASELVCANPAKDVSMACMHVNQLAPTIGATDTVFASYRPYQATFDSAGNATVHVDDATVPLIRSGQ